MMVCPEYLSCGAGTDTAGGGLACLSVADCFARVTGAVVVASDDGADSLFNTAGIVGATISVGAGIVGACGRAALAAGNSSCSASSGMGCAAMQHSLR